MATDDEVEKKEAEDSSEEESEEEEASSDDGKDEESEPKADARADEEDEEEEEEEEAPKKAEPKKAEPKKAVAKKKADDDEAEEESAKDDAAAKEKSDEADIPNQLGHRRYVYAAYLAATIAGRSSPSTFVSAALCVSAKGRPGGGTGRTWSARLSFGPSASTDVAARMRMQSFDFMMVGVGVLASSRPLCKEPAGRLERRAR